MPGDSGQRRQGTGWTCCARDSGQRRHGTGWINGHVRHGQVVNIWPGEVNAMEKLDNKAIDKRAGTVGIPRTWACGTTS